MRDFKIHKTGANILHEISSQVYTTLSRQIRELISNSLDAGAKTFTIKVNADSKELIFEDDGTGMTIEDIDEHYCVLSVSPQAAVSETIGRKGVGKFAIIGISPTFIMETRVHGSEKVFFGAFDYSKTMDPIFSAHDLSTISICQGDERLATDADPVQFTRIRCTGVSDEVLSNFTDEDKYISLVTKLQRILPLVYPKKHDALDQLTGTAKASLLDSALLTISVKIFCELYPKGHVLHKGIFGENQIEQSIWGKPWPVEYIFTEHNVSLFGYFIDMRESRDMQWQGLVVRIKNVAVKEHEFFDWIDFPIRARLTGEIHIVGIDDQKAITMNRSDFNMSNPVVIAISEIITSFLKEFGNIMRKRNQVRSEVKKVMKKMVRFYGAVEDIEHSWNAHIKTPPEKGSSVSELDTIEDTSFEDALRGINVDGHTIVDVTTFPSPAGAPLSKADIDIDKNGEVEISLDEALLSRVTYFGSGDDREEWTYELKAGEAENPPCEIDVDNKVIRLNTNHRLIRDISGQSLKIVVLLYLVYYHHRDDCDIMFEKLLQVLI